VQTEARGWSESAEMWTSRSKLVRLVRCKDIV
jgi:hypothetical protein